MLKINKSILIICIISLFLIIGQISASDTDSIKINNSNSIDESIGINDSNSIDESIGINDSNSIDESIRINDSNSIDESIELDNNELMEKNDDENIDDEIHDSIDYKKSVESDDSIKIIEKQRKDSSEIVMANDDYSCGAASFATALYNLGINVSLDEARIAANTTVNGTTMKGLVDAAAKYNLTAYAVKADISDLKENFIVHMNINGAKHWSVIKEINREKVTLADSSLGYVEYDLERFRQYYTNNSLIILNKSQINSLDMTKYTIIDNTKLNGIYGKGYAYQYSKKISYIQSKPKGYAFQVKIIVPKWGGNTVKVITKKITSHEICCNVYYKITYYKKAKYKGKGTTINYPCIFNLCMKKGKTVTVNLPTPGIRSLKFYHTVCKFP